MKILRTRAASVSRQGLCTALLVASLTTAAVGASPPHHTADAGDPAPGPGNPQRLPHGSPNLALPDLVPPPGTPGAPGSGTPDGGPDKATGIPATALAAYKNAEKLAGEQWPNCHVPWELIAGIGKVESDHGTMGGGLRTDGSTAKPIIGPPLTGDKFALVRDTDGGRYDGDRQFDHAVGPMQFIPSTWESYAADGRGTGQKDPNNIFDAAAGTARYLCAGGLDLSKQGDVEKAVLRYNSSRDYLNTVLAWMRTYQNGGGGAVADVPVGSPSGGSTLPTIPTVPPVPSVPTVPTTPSRPAPGNTTPATPKPNPKPKPDQSKPGGDKGKPGDHKPKPPATASSLELKSDQEVTADTGKAFPSLTVRAVTADGDPVTGTRVQFEVIGKNGPRFHHGRTATATVTATTGKDGLATVTGLTAGATSGTYTVRATIGDRGSTHADFTAVVTEPTPPKADEIVRPGNTPLSANAGASFGQPISLQANAKGKGKDKSKPVAKVKITATVYADGKVAKTGPYFKEGDNRSRTVTVTTGDDGKVDLPPLFADDRTGSFTLLLTTGDGVQLSLPLTVTSKPGEPTESGQPGDKGKDTGKGEKKDTKGSGKKGAPASASSSPKATRTTD
ncbi:lytic transglycosylase domain-containing protein [Streptomyces sp. CA-181903]|uniref:lytic transglycosylase domain-containing protein n=1 Tax=Streptomyces sp. CA-181903 TaxID=3240055 RepID=UPI003D94D522